MLAGDIVGDTIFTSTDTGVGPAASYSLASDIGDVADPQDVDMFRIHGAGRVGQQLTITTSLPAGETNDVDTYLRLFDEFGTQLAFDDNGGNDNYSQIVYLITSGNDLFVGVSGAPNTAYSPTGFLGAPVNGDTGKYRIDVSIAATDVGDTIDLSVDTGVSTLQDSYTASEFIGDGAFLAKDVDMYEVNVAAGEVLTITTSQPVGSSNPVNTIVRLFDAAGNQIAINDDIGGGNLYSEIVHPVTASGLYYVGVSGSPNSTYLATLSGSGVNSLDSGDYQIDISVPYDSDIIIQSARAVSGNTLEVRYEVVGGTVAPFDIGIFQSTNAVLDGDTLLSRPSVTLEADRTVGVHTVSFAIGSAVLLPGAGAVETNVDYHLLAVIDDQDNLLEIDADPLNEDNTAVIAGAYSGGSTVYVHGGLGADAIAIAADLTFSAAGGNYDFDNGVINEVRIRSHAGQDRIGGAASIESMRLWGGDDDDTLVSGTLSDVADGGAGSDTFEVTAVTNLTLTNAQVTGAGSDTFAAVERWHLIGTSGNNKLDAKNFTLGPVTLDGREGNDTLTGGDGSDLLIGGAGNDKYLFFAANAAQVDKVVEENGGGTDLLDFSSFSAALPVTVALNDANAIASHGSGGTLRSIITDPGKQSNLENVTGGAAGDNITGNGAKNALIGGLGDDTLSGGAGNDTLTGGFGHDTLIGGADNDSFVFALPTQGMENDSVADSSGSDTLNFSALTAGMSLMVDLNASGDFATHPNRTVDGNGPDFENVTSGAGDDVLIGNAANNSFTGNNGNDSLTGNGGNDTLSGGAGDDTLIGNAGNDKLTGGAGSDDLDGGADNDTYTFAAATIFEADEVFESTGADTLNFGSLGIGVDLLANLTQVGAFATHSGRSVTGNGLLFENVTAGAGNDTLTGNAAKNALTGNAGNDILIGNGEADSLRGGAGNDDYDGGDGNDTYTFDVAVGSESDDLLDSSGVDALIFNALGSTTHLTVNLTTIGAFATHAGRTVNGNGLDFENVNGGEGNDTITGNGFANKLDGRGGNDTLNGLGGNDNLIGGTGVDTFLIDGTSDNDDFDLALAGSKLRAQRRDVGSNMVEEQDTLTFEAVDFIHLRALEGDDLIDVSNAIVSTGLVDGGDGASDDCSDLPAGWTSVNCEL